jgi:flagellar protein FlbD
MALSVVIRAFAASRRRVAAAGARVPVAEEARALRAALHVRPDVRDRLREREENHSMIKLHHGREQREIWVNADLIETVEATPDTVVKLTTDRRLIVSETPEEIVALVVEHRRKAQSRPHVLTDR